MSGAWGGYANGAIPQSAMIRVKNDWFKPEVGKALANAIAECERAGIPITVNEGYRPLGVPADAKRTTGASSQWFQYGRMKRGETPSAAFPGTSVHGFAMAADVNPAAGNAIVKRIFAKHGFSFNISSESWHCEYVGVPKPIPAKPVSTDNWGILQAYLKTYYGYTGKVDNDPGPLTRKATQRWLADKWGYRGEIDGVFGPQSLAALKRAGSSLR